MKFLRIGFAIGLVIWTALCLAGVVLSLFFNGPETAFLIIWVAFAFVAVQVWLTIEGWAWFYRRLRLRITVVKRESGQPGGLDRRREPSKSRRDEQDQRWQGEYSTHKDDDEDEFPRVKEQFPRL